MRRELYNKQLNSHYSLYILFSRSETKGSLSALVHWDFSSQVQNFTLMKISKTETSKRLLLPRLHVSHGVCELKFHQSAQQPHLPILNHLKIYSVYILLIQPVDEDTEQCLHSSLFVTVLISKHQLDIELLTLLFKPGILNNPACLQSFHSAHASSYYK